MVPLRAPRGGLSEPLSWLLATAGNPWHSLACRRYHRSLCLHLHVVFFPTESLSLTYPSQVPLNPVLKGGLDFWSSVSFVLPSSSQNPFPQCLITFRALLGSSATITLR